MNIAVSKNAPTASLAPVSNGITPRPQGGIAIVGHIHHGKSKLVGRLLHETGSLPDAKLEMML